MTSKNFYKNKYKIKFPRLNYTKGVTLIELIVVILIFMIISSITIFNYGKFRSSLSVQNLADDIALSVRRAQGFAIGVRGSGGSFTPGYGIHLTSKSTTSLYQGSNKSFILFTDISGEGQYNNSTSTCGNPTSNDECLELINIITTDKIESIFKNNETTAIAPTDTIDILFRRPNPEPIFCHRYGGTGACTSSISSIKIKIATEADSSINKIITIYNNGQISVSGSL